MESPPSEAPPEGLRHLTAPFSPAAIKWRPGTLTKNKDKALALAYVDARDVMERLDAAVGCQNWSDKYTVISLEQGVVECTIALRFPQSTAVSKSDVGYPNSGMDDDEPFKAAYSDAFKRAAVKFGIGRELYSIPKFWLPLDENKRFGAVPQWIEGRGWVAPGNQVVSVADESLRRKMFAAFSAHKLSGDQARAVVAAVVGKVSTKGLDTSEVEKILDYLDDPEFVATIRDVRRIVPGEAPAAE